jgi:cephalosporin-C deacetylase-like acetyl esterase
MPQGRRAFLKAGIVGGASMVGPRADGSAAREAANLSSPSRPPAFNISIRDYLAREAQRITDGALADYKDAASWKRLLPERRRQYLEMMGLDVALPGRERSPLNVKVTGVFERPGYRIEKLYYESLPKLYVTGNLYVPANLTARAPGVLYVCGHAVQQKVHYQAHARRFAELGFVCLLIETVQRGEGRGYHHGPYFEGWFHWYSRGYSPAAVETLNGMRALDLLSERKDVDAERLGVTGISGGGVTSWWVAAADERIKVAAPVCGTSTLASYIADLTIDGNCDCIWWNNTYRWDHADVAALVAPRPLLIAATEHDDVFAVNGAREVHAQVERLYRLLGAAPNLKLVVTPGGHGYDPRSRTEIFSWFLKHLQGKHVPPDEVGDVDASPTKQESEETLRVFVEGSPTDNRNPLIQEDFFPPLAPPELADAAGLAKERAGTIAALRQKTFGAFPKTPPPLDAQVEFEYEFGHDNLGQRFAFTSEEGWRLRGALELTRAASSPAPAVVMLRSFGERRPDGTTGASEQSLRRLNAPWAKIVVEPRGTGETAWGEHLNWHLRRASAWTGRTLASMGVWDALRALEAVRSLPRVDAKHVSLAGRGDMAAVALYAALLDGGVETLFLQDPPATQDAPSARDGRGPAIEMLNCLRTTDLPYLAGMLYPTEIVIVGECPSSYDWAEHAYRRLGAGEKFRRVADWRSF